MVDARPFPQDIRVAVKNDNKPEPDSDDKFSGHCTFQHDGELYDFAPGKAVLLTPEVAYWMFLYDTRTDVRNGIEEPRNYRDKMSTGVIGNSSMGSHTTLWDQKLAALGWEKDPRKRSRFEKFSCKAFKLNTTVSAEEFAKM